MIHLDRLSNIMRLCAPIALLSLVALATSSSRSQVATDLSDSAPGIESYVPLVAELELRRRVNVLFPNPQSLFDGFQLGFVNVGTGNLTFIRRDLTIATRSGPISFGRVYDSRIEENDDFGRGWHLNLLEELHMSDDGSLVYVDSSGSRYRFREQGAIHVPDIPVAELANAELAIRDDIATLRFERGNRIHTFRRSADGSSFQLIRIQGP